MIDLNKEYVTRSNFKTKLFEILDNKIFGSYLDVFDQTWYPYSWSLNGTSRVENLDLVLKEFNIIDILQNYSNYKTITYFGTYFHIPLKYNYVVTSKNGTIYATTERPKFPKDKDYVRLGTEFVVLAECNFSGNYEDSIQELE